MTVSLSTHRLILGVSPKCAHKHSKDLSRGDRRPGMLSLLRRENYPMLVEMEVNRPQAPLYQHRGGGGEEEEEEEVEEGGGEGKRGKGWGDRGRGNASI